MLPRNDVTSPIRCRNEGRAADKGNQRNKGDIVKTKGLGFMQLTIVVGFCLYYGYYLIAFFGAFAELPPSMDFTEAHLGQFVFFVGSIIGTEEIGRAHV